MSFKNKEIDYAKKIANKEILDITKIPRSKLTPNICFILACKDPENIKYIPDEIRTKGFYQGLYTSAEYDDVENYIPPEALDKEFALKYGFDHWNLLKKWGSSFDNDYWQEFIKRNVTGYNAISIVPIKSFEYFLMNTEDYEILDSLFSSFFLGISKEGRKKYIPDCFVNKIMLEIENGNMKARKLYLKHNYLF